METKDWCTFKCSPQNKGKFLKVCTDNYCKENAQFLESFGALKHYLKKKEFFKWILEYSNVMIPIVEVEPYVGEEKNRRSDEREARHM